MSYRISCISPIGRLVLCASEIGLTSISLAEGVVEEMPCDILLQTKAQLNEYFGGKRKTFEIPLDFTYGSDFMKKVWTELTNIPFGATISYLELAKKVGTERHTRAVGLANGKNPIPIIVPCHRVIGSDGSLTGYALGLKVKMTLLNIEQPGRYSIQTSLF